MYVNVSLYPEITKLSSGGNESVAHPVDFPYPRMMSLPCQAPDFSKGIRIASAGHSAAQKPHSSQNSSSMRAFPSLSTIACGGQASRHCRHPVQVSSSIRGIISAFLSDSLREWRYGAASVAWHHLSRAQPVRNPRIRPLRRQGPASTPQRHRQPRSLSPLLARKWRVSFPALSRAAPS